MWHRAKPLAVPVKKNNFGCKNDWILAKAPWWWFVHSFKDMQSVIKF